MLPDAPLRDPVTGDIIGDSPFMDSLIVIITIIFFAAGLAYGRGAGTIRTTDEVIASITKSWAGLASLLFLFLLIAQFIAYFNYSNMAQVAAVKLGDWLEEANVGAVWLLIGFVFVTLIVDFIMPAAIAKWAILAPIFIPLFLRLDIAPQTVLAAYRVGDSPANVITPLMAYFPLIVIFAQRYRKDAGIGTVVSMMLPSSSCWRWCGRCSSWCGTCSGSRSARGRPSTSTDNAATLASMDTRREVSDVTITWPRASRPQRLPEPLAAYAIVRPHVRAHDRAGLPQHPVNDRAGRLPLRRLLGSSACPCSILFGLRRRAASSR